MSRNYVEDGDTATHLASAREVVVRRLVVFGTELAKPLNRRRRISVELPEFVIRAINWRVEEANANDAETDDVVDFNDVVEWLLVSEVTIRRMPHLEENIPGFTAAMSVWLMNATYQSEVDDE